MGSIIFLLHFLVLLNIQHIHTQFTIASKPKIECIMISYTQYVCWQWWPYGFWYRCNLGTISIFSSSHLFAIIVVYLTLFVDSTTKHCFLVCFQRLVALSRIQIPLPSILWISPIFRVLCVLVFFCLLPTNQTTLIATGKQPVRTKPPHHIWIWYWKWFFLSNNVENVKNCQQTSIKISVLHSA